MEVPIRHALQSQGGPITGIRGSILAPGAPIKESTWTLEEENWWEPELRNQSASVVDRTTGEIFMFNHGHLAGMGRPRPA